MKATVVLQCLVLVLIITATAFNVMAFRNHNRILEAQSLINRTLTDRVALLERAAAPDHRALQVRP